MQNLQRDPASFRDPSGHVYLGDSGQIYRTVLPVAAESFSFVQSTGLLEQLVAAGQVLPYELDPAGASTIFPQARHVLAQPRLPVISYPYEWSFHGLRAAALLHLDIQVAALKRGVALSDASAYNVQFQGASPVFIDMLSFRPYREGEFWGAHRQFCEQFLNPLLMTSTLGLDFHGWYRGRPEGITTVDLAKLIPTWRRLGWKMLTHVTLQARFQSTPRPDAVRLARTATLPQAAYRNVLESLRDWIASLTPAAGPQSVWRDYSKSVHYSSDESAAKRALVSRFVGDAAPELLLDIGCNSGDYAAIALDAGAKYVVGLEADTGALDAAFCRAQRDRLMFLPLRADAADPSPAQGWRGLERPALETRCKPDKLLALAVIHHLALSRNIPLPDIVRWLVSLAPEGLVEFVPKTDGKVLEMLSLREDIFADYDEARFRSELERHANIRSASRITESGRVLYWYKVKTSSEASHQMIGR